VRLVVALALAAAVTVMLGVILVAASVVMRLLTRQHPADMARLGLELVAAGIVFGLVVLVVFAVTRIGSIGRLRTSRDRDRRSDTSRPQSALSDGPGRSPGHGGAQGNSMERLRAGAPPGGGGRSARPLNPTNVYTPGGLIDVPRDGRAIRTSAGQAIPELLRTAGLPPGSGASGPGAQGGGWGQDRPSSAWARSQPAQHGYQPGLYPGGPGWGTYASGGPPPPVPSPSVPSPSVPSPSVPSPSVPSREQMRPQEAPWPGHALPPREPGPPRGPGPPREPGPSRGAAPSHRPQALRPDHAGPPRDTRPLRDVGPPREGTGPRGPIRPGGPVPPREPVYPPPGQGPRQGSAAGVVRHAAGPGHAGPGGHRPDPGYPGSPGPAEAPLPFDDGYAKVIRASDYPVRPSGPARPPGLGEAGDPGRPSGPGRPFNPARQAAPPADVYVYRDTDGLSGDSVSPAPGPDENDPAYWYDLPVTGLERSAGADQPGGSDESTPHVRNETRGPFEPLVSSAGPPRTPPRISGDAGSSPGEGREDIARARRLEQIKDLYLTAEAIGEANVDKHFDQLLTQQRELISEYFKRPGAASAPDAPPGGALPANAPDGAPPATAPDGPAGLAGDDPEGTRMAADQPRVW
jgi:hypothetical protein